LDKFSLRERDCQSTSSSLGGFVLKQQEQRLCQFFNVVFSTTNAAVPLKFATLMMQKAKSEVWPG
jgi:hypothetical protein